MATKIEKEFTITMPAEEAEKVLAEYLKKTHGYTPDKVIFNIEADTDDRGNYSGQIMESVIFKGKLN